MDRKELMEAIKSAYQKGYREGFTDACDLMRNTTVGLVQSMLKGLEGHTIVVDEKADQNEIQVET